MTLTATAQPLLTSTNRASPKAVDVSISTEQLSKKAADQARYRKSDHRRYTYDIFFKNIPKNQYDILQKTKYLSALPGPLGKNREHRIELSATVQKQRKTLVQ